MPDETPTTTPVGRTATWCARRGAISLADDTDRDRLHEAFDREWKDAYRTEFVRFAVSRNWKSEDAAVWADEIVSDALLWEAEKHEYCPIQTAQHDVVECEMETVNA